jgi:RNA polymerase sigma factor (sigma-70 family)
MTSPAGAAVAGERFQFRPNKRLNMANQSRSNQRFREVVLPHLADALSLARWLTGSRHDAEDVVQDACIRALQGIDTYEGRNARAWVLTVVRNTCFTWLAKHRPKSLVLVGDMSEIDEVSQAGTERHIPSPEVELIREADMATVEASIAALPHPFREVLVLRDVNGLSYKEIANMLTLPIGTVMSRLARARGLLAVTIEKAQ